MDLGGALGYAVCLFENGGKNNGTAKFLAVFIGKMNNMIINLGT